MMRKWRKMKKPSAKLIRFKQKTRHSIRRSDLDSEVRSSSNPFPNPFLLLCIPRTMRTVIINGTETGIDQTELTYEDIVAIVAERTGRDALWTVTYRCRRPLAEGFLTPGQSTEVEEGMIFNAAITDSA